MDMSRLVKMTISVSSLYLSDMTNNEESNPLYDQMSAIDAVLYKSYKVLLLHKIRSKIEVNLG